LDTATSNVAPQQTMSQIDLPNLIEEIESLGKQQRQELRNRLSVLIGHLLKWEYQPQHRSRSWQHFAYSAVTLRLLKDNPSLNPYLDALPEAYENARDLVEKLPARANLSTRLSLQLDWILDDRFYPGEPSELVDNSEL